MSRTREDASVEEFKSIEEAIADLENDRTFLRIK